MTSDLPWWSVAYQRTEATRPHLRTKLVQAHDANEAERIVQGMLAPRRQGPYTVQWVVPDELMAKLAAIPPQPQPDADLIARLSEWAQEIADMIARLRDFNTRNAPPLPVRQIPPLQQRHDDLRRVLAIFAAQAPKF